jgi:hypothetical protein
MVCESGSNTHEHAGHLAMYRNWDPSSVRGVSASTTGRAGVEHSGQLAVLIRSTAESESPKENVCPSRARSISSSGNGSKPMSRM